MGAQAIPMTTAQVAVEHQDLARYLHARLAHRVTFEEARDAAAEALVEAQRVMASGAVIADRRRWLRRTAWHKAIDMARRHEGQGENRRRRPVSLSLVEDHDARASVPGPDEEVADHAARHADARALWAAWGHLGADEQRALAMRYFQGRPVGEVLSALGCTRSHYDNVVKRALRILRRELVAMSAEAGCRTCRQLIFHGSQGALSGVQAAQRDAHLAGCLSCRAYAHYHSGMLG